MNHNKFKAEIDRKKIDFTAPLPIMKTKPLPPLCGPTPPPENFQFPNGALVCFIFSILFFSFFFKIG